MNAANGGVDGTGDDSSQTANDEDSITAFPSLKVGSTGYSLDNIPLSNTSGGAATLYGWVDFNQNGQFDGNEVATASVPAGAVSATLNWTGLSGVTAGASYVRLRLTTQALTNTNSATPASIDTRSYGAANDGEVEDYALTITALDYGDAPSNMSSIDASLGAVYGDAWHSMTGNVMLGSSIDGESASQSAGLLANGDGGDDDGVAFPLIDTTPVLRAGEGNTLTITAGSAGYLNAWIDWNQDGDWSDVGEQVATNTQLNAGANTLSLTPALTAPHGATYARFRFTSASVATPTPTGAAVDGEVEDYRVSIVLPKPVAACFGIGNSGFEEPALATSMDFPPEDTVPYWGTIAVDPASGSNFSARNAIEIWTSGFNGVPAFQGQQFAELNAHVAGMLYQDIETDPGTVLHWSFAHRGRQTNETLNLLVGSPGAEILQRSVTTGTAGWLVYSGTYTVPAGQKITRFGFQAANGGSLGNFLDAISFSAECPDWSDAPASYADVSHQKVAGIQLGASVTNDPGPYQSANADGDVSDDGVSIPTLAQGQTATITATVSGAGGYLQGWVDWNGNGNFNDSGEQVALNLQDNGAGDSNAAAGTIAFTLNVPANAATSQTFARFRWSTTNNLNGTAAANDGEVEDYALTILAKGIISGTVFRDDDQSNVKDGAETGIDLITVQLYNDNGTPTDVSDDTLAATTQTSGGGTYSFPDLDPGSYLLRVDTADADLPAGALIGTTHPQTGITVTAGNTTTVNFGFDIFTCVPGGGTADGAVTAYISKEVEGGSVAARSEADTLDDAWRSAAGLPTSGTQLPWLGTASATMGSSAPALFKTYGVAVDVASVNIQPSSPCLGSASSASTYLGTGSTLQASAPRPASLYNSAAQPAFWYDAGGDSQSPNAVRFTFAEPVKSFGAWFGDLETRSDGNARPAWLRLLDSSGNQIGQDISIEPGDISSGAGATAVDQNLCGSTAPGTDSACGNTSTRWVGFVDSTASARIKHVLVIVGDDDFGDDAGTELISFIGMDIVQEDYGDAPGSYGDAIHWLSLMPKLYLGSASPDKEDQSQNAAHGGADGSGDDADGSDDEDGVANFPVLANGDKDYSLNVTVNNTSGSTAQLVGWIDFNHNGVFDSTEAATVAVPTGANNRITALTWNNLPGDTQPGSSYLRLRLTTDSSIAAGMASTSLPTGTAEDGEVEDYAITIGDSGYTVSGTVYNDANVNGSNDAEDGIKDVTVVLYDTAGNTCRSSKTGADGSYSFSGVQPAVADNYVLYEAADESHEAPEICPPVASDPNGYASSTANSQTITVSTANVSGVDFGDVKVPTFMLENSQVILPNTTVAYPHMFRSAADGAVTFTLTESADPSSIEWGTSLYLDNNCDAALDAGDAAITGSITVNAGDKLCILTKVLAPANATAGAQHSLDVTSSFVYGDGSVITLAAEQTRTDITSTSSGTSSDPVGGEGKLSLVKSVWNASRGTAVGDNDGSVALPGETLRYTIQYENIGNGELDELVVHDSVPAFTQLGGAGQACGATPPELSACTPASNGESLDWSFTGKLQAGSSGDVYYEVVVE
ncbi:MAG: hypothetical protein KJ914_05865 [Gammaproteobacteria bacterium]|nr:hypothetical protein [Gammaproteobacteria bacterium]MBU1725498.1 hypothetical protein [Gammaproteobacteria bacterium]MBU2007356.1 hypothetical protein [Gammaproteobacteria bacterium]